MKWRKRQTPDPCIHIMVKILHLHCIGQKKNIKIYIFFNPLFNTIILYRNQMGKPMASVRPMQSMSNTSAVIASRNALNRRWIPAEVWQKQGMSAQEMTLPLGN